ncbi:MAG: aromatic hydrocarbon degradation protein, partial [Bacteroidales bacterium]|nr:aromatic hydrocarbon degradation protein [Bacteroidales bacterium]
MKRLFVSLLMVAAILPATIYAGGIVTNTNQSASFIRMPAQDATIGIEGTYYNPAGLVHLENGFYISVSSQTVMQTR